MNILFTEEVAIEINKMMIREYSPGEMCGVKEPNLLNSAINRPNQTMFGEYLYKDVYEKAVALYESLAKNHAFYNANKRTAFACMAYYLFERGHVCVINEANAADLTVDFVVGKLTFDEVVEVVKKNSYRKNRGHKL